MCGRAFCFARTKGLKDMKSATAFAAAALAACAFGAPVPIAPQVASVPVNHVTAEVAGIAPAAKGMNHIEIVNVGGAVPEAMWPEVVTYAASRIQVTIWTNAVGKSVLSQLVSGKTTVKGVLGDKATVAVFIENADGQPPFISSLCSWSVVNVRGIDRDSPDAQKLKDRYAKMILKGIGAACGSGLSLDRRSSLFIGSYSLAGMDKTCISISPDTYFPMLEVLRGIGGDEIVSPPVLEDEGK